MTDQRDAETDAVIELGGRNPDVGVVDFCDQVVQFVITVDGHHRRLRPIDDLLGAAPQIDRTGGPLDSQVAGRRRGPRLGDGEGSGSASRIDQLNPVSGRIKGRRHPNRKRVDRIDHIANRCQVFGRNIDRAHGAGRIGDHK